MSAQVCEMTRIGPRIRIGMAFAVLAIAVAIVARQWSTAEPRAASEARQALAAGRYDEAGSVLTRWLRAQPAASEAHVLKGRVAVAMGRINEAADELKRAQALGHALDDLALLRAMIASKIGRHAEAEPALKRAFDEGRTPDRQVDEALAKTYLETFNLEGAAKVLDRWASEFPDDPKPHLWRAEIHSRTGGDAGAVEKDYREALGATRPWPAPASAWPKSCARHTAPRRPRPSTMCTSPASLVTPLHTWALARTSWS